MLRLHTNLKQISPIVVVSPLFDVLFLLLIFFVVYSSMVFQPGIPVELPESLDKNMRQVVIPTRKMVLVISKQRDTDGRQLMYFNNKVIRLEEFEQVFVEAISENRELRKAYLSSVSQQERPVLILMADKSTPHGTVSRIRALASSHKITVFDIYDGSGK
jgi:biopolymer transport protein ExbD